MDRPSPPEERPAYVFELSSSVALAWTVLGTVLFVAAGFGVTAAYFLAGHQVRVEGSGWFAWLIAAVMVLPLHELVHVAAVVALGGRPGVGAGVKSAMPYLYVTAPGQRFSRDGFIAITLAPFVVIDAIGLLLIWLQPAWSWVVPAVAFNTSGAIGDLWIFALLVRFPRWAVVEDQRLGLSVWAPAGHSVEELAGRAPRTSFRAPGWVGIWLVATLVLLPVISAVLTGLVSRQGRVAAGPIVLAAVHRAAGSGGAQLELNLLLDAAAAALLALPVAWLIDLLRRQVRIHRGRRA